MSDGKPLDPPLDPPVAGRLFWAAENARVARAIQLFTDQQLEHSRSLSKTQIAQFLEEFRILYGGRIARSDSDTASKSLDG